MASTFSNFVATKHGVAESTLLKATQVGHHYNLVNESKDIDNGSVAKIGDRVKSDVFKAEVPQIGDKIVLILTAVKIYEEYTIRMQEESNFYNAANEVMRAYEIQDTDRFTLSKEAFNSDAVLEVGKYVFVDGKDFKLTTGEKPSMTEYGFVGHIYEVAANGNYRIWVDKNAQVYA
jgi:hypothetical protein|nr:MAG TPA: hypothetical protein [Caudoviricetes sp.]